LSRLKKKLSGEKITERDAVDEIMDKYLRPDYDRMCSVNMAEEKLIGNDRDRPTCPISLTWREMRSMSAK
jgi:hypothetical protein